MKKILCLFLCIHMFADSGEENKFSREKQFYKNGKSKNLFHDFIIYYKPSYFYPQDSKFRKIYKAGMLSLLEIDYFILKKCSLWAEGGYFSKKKYIGQLKRSSRIYLIPIGIGLKYGERFYGKIGINIFHMKSREKIFLKNSQNSLGGTFGIGWIFDIQRGWVGNIFSEYFYNKKKVYEKNSGEIFFKYIGGFSFGGGIGYRF